MFESIESHAQHVVEFVRVHEPWAAPIVFALAFGESLAFISLLIPAWAALVGIGVLISHGNLNFWPIWVAGGRRRARRLAVLLARREARTTGGTYLAVVAPPRTAAEGRDLCEAL